MSAATLTARPLVTLPDPRPIRGKHRTRPSLGELADRTLAGWRRARLEVAVAAASVGAVLASVLS